MRHNERHLTREELLLFIDGEMDGDAVIQVKVHLASCIDCSASKQKIETALNAVDEFCRSDRPLGDDQTDHWSLLQMRLRQRVKNDKLWWKRALLLQPISYVAIMLLVATLSVGLAHYRSTQQTGAYAQDRPNPDLTPGAVKQVRYEDVCPGTNDDKDPTVPIEMQRAVFHEYGVEPARKGHEFQIDYLISPQLGGTGEIRNLWPQPYESTVWNAHAKDTLEDRLHAMVCTRELDLSEAQREIATDWIGAYKKYFGTQTPLREEAVLRVQ